MTNPRQHIRQVFLDTETTGLEPAEGHRIIEIGCVEMVDRKITGNRYHQYIQPDREVDDGALEVHGISNAFLADKPRFAECYHDFLKFIDQAELVIHNAAFDVGFLNHEFALCDPDSTPLDQLCSVVDSLQIARNKHPGQKNNLDALCKRYDVDNTHRDLHGALLDAEILAEVYLRMTGGQISLSLGADASDTLSDSIVSTWRPVEITGSRPKVIRATEDELAAHQQRLEKIRAGAGTILPWPED